MSKRWREYWGGRGIADLRLLGLLFITTFCFPASLLVDFREVDSLDVVDEVIPS